LQANEAGFEPGEQDFRYIFQDVTNLCGVILFRAELSAALLYAPAKNAPCFPYVVSDPAWQIFNTI